MLIYNIVFFGKCIYTFFFFYCDCLNLHPINALDIIRYKHLVINKPISRALDLQCIRHNMSQTLNKLTLEGATVAQSN